MLILTPWTQSFAAARCSTWCSRARVAHKLFTIWPVHHHTQWIWSLTATNIQYKFFVVKEWNWQSKLSIEQLPSFFPGQVLDQRTHAQLLDQLMLAPLGRTSCFSAKFKVYYDTKQRLNYTLYGQRNTKLRYGPTYINKRLIEDSTGQLLQSVRCWVHNKRLFA